MKLPITDKSFLGIDYIVNPEIEAAKKITDTIDSGASSDILIFEQEDIHHKAGMQCVDCHDSYELMGDGKLYMHEEDQVMISCEDCHFSTIPGLLHTADLDNETQKILRLKELVLKTHLFPLLTKSIYH